MKVSSKLLLGLAALSLLGAPGRTTSAASVKADECTMKQTEDGQYCPKCDKLLDKDDVGEDGKHKGDCGTAAVKVKVCVKKTYSCDCGKTSEKPVEC